MLIRFLQDYRGVLTGEVFFTFGTQVDLPNGEALVSAGRAELVKSDPVVEKAPTVDKPSPKPKPKSRRK